MDIRPRPRCSAPRGPQSLPGRMEARRGPQMSAEVHDASMAECEAFGGSEQGTVCAAAQLARAPVHLSASALSSPLRGFVSMCHHGDGCLSPHKVRRKNGMEHRVPVRRSFPAKTRESDGRVVSSPAAEKMRGVRAPPRYTRRSRARASLHWQS